MLPCRIITQLPSYIEGNDFGKGISEGYCGSS